MAMSSYRWALHCRKCRTFIASNDTLILGVVPPSQHHLAVKPGREAVVHDYVRKVERHDENSKRTMMSKYKLLCQNCDAKLGGEELIEGEETLCFKAEAIFIKNRYGGEIKENKLKKLLPELRKCGIEEVNLASTRKRNPAFAMDKRPTVPLTYCDVSGMSREEINSLTVDNPREYQAELFCYAMHGNSLIFLPTGSGKTLIAAMAISCMKKLNPGKLAVFIVDRIPLAHQQGAYIKKQVPVLKVGILTGDSSTSEANKSSWEHTTEGLAENKIDVLVLTHQLFLNFLADPHSVVAMSDVCILVIDEAHRCQGNHVFHQIIRDHYVKVSPDKFKPLVLALTASPAGETTLDGTLTNLRGLLDRLCCSARMPVTSQDLELYANKPVACHKVIPLSPLQQRFQEEVVRYLKSIDARLTSRHVPTIPINGMSPLAPNYRGALRQIICKCHEEENTEGHALGEMAMHFIGVLELNNVLGLQLAMECLQECFELIDNASTPMESQKNEIVRDDYDFYIFKMEIEKIRHFREAEHGKFPHLVKELKEFALRCQNDDSSRGIVFVNMRKTAHKFCERLKSHSDISKILNPRPFVGHGEGSDGMAWHGEQEVALKQFRSGHTKLLISTNVLEEGLDVPICNLVIRFDTSPSLRSYVQSRGRASRRPDSRFIVLYSDQKKQEEAALVEEKEKNMELAMRILHNTSHSSTSQAKTFACEAKKPPFEVRGPNKPSDQIPPQEDDQVKYSTIQVPCVRVVAHTSRASTTQEMPSIILFFTRNYEVKSMEAVDTKMNCIGNEEYEDTDSPRGAFRFELECQNGQNSFLFLEDVTKSWCGRPVCPDVMHSQAWLETLDVTRKKRNVEVDVLPAKSFFIGYFRHQTKFCQHWPDPLVTELRNIRLVFQHDLKALLIFFTVRENSQTNLYEIEIPYTELGSFIVVDRKEGYANLFLSLNNSPRLYMSEEGAKWESIVIDSESGYYSGDESDDEEASGDEGYQVGYDIGYENEENKDDGDDASHDDTDAGHDDTGGGDDDDDEDHPNENIIHTAASAEENDAPTFSHPILKALNVITGWYRVSCVADSQDAFGQCPNYMFKVSNTDLDNVCSGLKACGKDMFFAGVATDTRPLLRATEVYLPPRLDEEIKYAVQSLFSYHPVVLGRITTIDFGLLLASKPKNTVLAALEKLDKILDEDSFCQPVQTLEKILQDPNLRCFRFTPQSVPGHCALIKRLIITPTRLLFSPEEIMQNNRVLRNYNPANFVCANIRDEDCSRISSSSSDLTMVLLRIKNILDEGVDICGQRYLFLGCSNSQLRNHSCWFVKSSSDPDAIRDWMGDFSSIRCVGTYVSRMGQCFSTSLDTVGISIDDGVRWSDEQDVVTEDKKYTFSDGVGGISQELAKEVVKKIGKKFKPSAFQIRFAGYKGVLAVDSRLTGKQAFFRPSMRKFQSTHRRLEVIQTSRPQAVFLNHQIIMLLSNLGVPEEAFLRLMREALDNLAGMLLDERRAVQQMSSAVKIGIEYRSLSEAGLPLTVEPFFRCVIAAVYYDSLQSLLTKARIKLPADKARLMMGVMDETGTLQYGQVFVQYSAVSTDPKSNEDFDFNKKIILKGPVMVTRNPCLHPGDVRKLVAVDAPQLRHLVDCVVFPKTGIRPHPSEMAGGDLDGDLYYVSWHEKLFLHPEKDLFPPMDYTAPPKKQTPSPITPADMTSFIMDYIRSDQLGIIDNAHKALADIQPQGVESEKCLLLAEAHSLAVDAPKTGIWPDVKALDLRLEQYPDFMMKTDKPSYKSNKLLGKLYRSCRAFKRNAEQSLPTDVQRPVVDRAFVVKGYEKYVTEARELYSEYSDNLERLITIYGIDSEAELVSGCFRKLYKRLSKERIEVAEIVRRLVSDVRMKFRKRFFEEFKMDSSRHKPEHLQSISILQKASAWYHVAYAEPPSPSRGPKNVRFLSFPWVVDDVMTSIRKQKKTGLACNFSLVTMQQDGGPQNFFVQDVNDIHFKGPKVNDISRGLMKRLQDDKEMLLLQYKRRLSGKNLVLQSIQGARKNVKVAMFGSSATFLFREDSDVDLCVYEPTRRNPQNFSKKEQLKLLKSVRPLMGKMFKYTRLVPRAKVPVILCKNFKKTKAPPLCVDVPFDLSASRNGLDKAIVVSYYIMSDPPLLPILRFLLLWGHVSGLTGHGKRICVNTNALVFIFLSHCVVNGYLDEISRDVARHFYERNTVEKSVDYLQDWENILEHLVSSTNITPTLRGFSLGEVLIQFFASYTALERLQIPESISRLVNAKSVDDLLKSCSMSFLQEQMQRAYHLLAVHGDLETLLNLCATEVRSTVCLSTGLSAAMKGAERENARELQERTGAIITIRPKFKSFVYRLILEVRGTELQVEAVEHLIQDMSRTTSAMRAAFMSMCFVKGASQILFEGCRDDDDAVTLVPYHSHHHPQHDGNRLYTPMLATPIRFNTCALSLASKEFADFRQKFLTQFALAARDHEAALHGEMEFTVRFGRIYIFRLPKSFIEDAESVTVKMLQANLQRGYKAKPTGTQKTKRELVVTESGFSRRNTRRSRQKQKKPKENKKKEKKMKEKPCRSSYFTIVKSKEQVERFLRQQHFQEVNFLEVFDVNTKGNQEINVKFDGNFNFTELCFSPLRWCLTDVKRRWKWNRRCGKTQDGDESDVRFILQSRRSLSQQEILDTEYEVYQDLMQQPLEVTPAPKPTKKQKRMFSVKEDLWNEVSMVRHKKTQQFRCGLANNPFLSRVSAELSEVTEYSRPVTECSCFRKTFTRHELDLQLDMPPLSTSEGELSVFLGRVWQLAFEISTFLSLG